MNLNFPDTRQNTLAQRLRAGRQIVAADVAREFAVSTDTVRRDILALEAAGVAHRVRGGAVPVALPSSPLHERLSSGAHINPSLIREAAAQIGDAATLILDGGSTALSLIQYLPERAGRLVITPSPWNAIACHERGIDVFMIGGKLSAMGGSAVGDWAHSRLAEFAADIAILGACGLDADFGLSSDEFEESQLKQAMQASARRTIVVTAQTKLGKRARYHTLPLSQIDCVITDASPEQTTALKTDATEIINA
jgi:DeoR family fructose operon transcriptional repressor